MHKLPPKNYFRMANGVIVKDITELLDAVDQTDSWTFTEHVNEQRNDFATWVHDVYGLKNLSKALNKSRTKLEMLRVLDAYYKVLQEKKYIDLVNKVETQATSTSADQYFDQNPVLISQVIEAKKKTLKLEQLNKFTQDIISDKTVEAFKDMYSKVYERMSFLRKNGYDTSLAQIMVLRIPTKIKVFEVTNSESDFIIVRRLLNEAVEELNSFIN